MAADYGDSAPNKAKQIKLSDIQGYYGSTGYSSPPTVQSALMEIGAGIVGGGASSASDVTVETSDFNGALSATDSNVWHALNTLDDAIVSGGHDPVTVTNSTTIGGTVTGQDLTFTDIGSHQIQFFGMNGLGNPISGNNTKVVEYNCTVSGWRIFASESGNYTGKIYKSTDNGTTYSEISGSEGPTLAAQSFNADVSFSSFNGTISQGDLLRLNTVSSNLTNVKVSIYGDRR